PTRRGESVMLDLGANIECDAENLVQFALMGDVFARTVLGLVQPTVGLLNVGSEDLKGNDAVRGASAGARGVRVLVGGGAGALRAGGCGGGGRGGGGGVRLPPPRGFPRQRHAEGH